MARILVVEDNARMGELVTQGLTARGLVVDCVATLGDAEAMLATTGFDLLILDLSLPDGNGDALLRNLRREKISIPVLVVSARSEVQSRVALLESGADDYLVKPFALDELAARARAILRRPSEQTSKTIRLGNVELNNEGLQASVDGEPFSLSRSEFLLLQAMMSHAGKVLPRERLEALVYNADAANTPNAFEAVVSRLRRRLQAGNASLTITHLRGLGYLLSEVSAAAEKA
jgi:DNA-binding response OmpR family regulator